MQFFPAALQNLSDQFARLPGIGGKTAQRLAFHVLSLPLEEAEQFAEAILKAKQEVHTCPCCQNLTDRELCPICDDDLRDQSLLCVVAEADITAQDLGIGQTFLIKRESSRMFQINQRGLRGILCNSGHAAQPIAHRQ